MRLPSTRYWILFAILFVGAGGAYFWWPSASASQELLEARQAVTIRDFPRAITLLKSHLEKWPHDREGHLLLAQTARRADQYALFEPHLRTYQQQEGDAEIVAIERILIGIQRGEFTTFDGGFQFCEKHPNHAEVPLIWEAMTRGYLKVRQLRKAIEGATRWLATNPLPADGSEALLWRGTCWKNSAALDLARKDFQEAIEKNPRNLEAHFQLGEILTQREPDEAMKHFRQVLEVDPKRTDARLGLARCHRNLSELDQADAILEELSREESPTLLPVLIERGKLAMDRKTFPEAESFLRKALLLNSQSLEGNRTLARSLQLQGKDSQAEEVRKKVTEIESELTKKLQAMIAEGSILPPDENKP